MKKIKGLLDGIPVVLNVPESLQEFKEGARLSSGILQFNEGYLFNFIAPTQILLENSGVTQDLQVLYFHKFKKYGVVEELSMLKAWDAAQVSSVGFYPIALELRKDFCEQHSMVKGSTLILQTEL